MPQTLSQVALENKRTFQKVIPSIFHEDDNNQGSVASALLIALGGVEDFMDVLTLSTDDIDSLYYYVKNEVEVTKRNKEGKEYSTVQTTNIKTELHKGTRGKLKTFISYTRWKAQKGEDLAPDYNDLDERDFTQYRRLFGQDGYNPVISTPKPGVLNSPKSSTKLDVFNKGIKRDVTQFPILKDESNFK